MIILGIGFLLGLFVNFLYIKIMDIENKEKPKASKTEDGQKLDEKNRETKNEKTYHQKKKKK